MQQIGHWMQKQMEYSFILDMEIFEAFIRLCEQYGIWAIELSGSDFQKKKREETNYYMSSIETVKRLTDIPVIMTGGVRSIQNAEEALWAGADMIGMSRPFISEPWLMLKWENQKSRCISCCKCFSIYQEEKRHCIFEE